MTGARDPGGDPAPRSPRSRAPMAFATVLALLLVTGFLSLGTWQVHRLAWKRALIAQVDARLAAAPVPAPGPSAWPAIAAGRDGYRRLSLDGVYLNDRSTLVQAATVLGSGYWLMTPLRTVRGFVVLVNRGFVPPGWRAPAQPATVRARITGLLRLTEPRGGFLRHNDPAAGRWYSRDVAAIAARRGLTGVAPYFVDAARSGPGYPAGGLTVIAFPNNHLAYAVTWYALALMTVGGWIVLIRAGRRP